MACDSEAFGQGAPLRGSSQDQSAGTAAAARDFGWKALTSSYDVVKQGKLATEIAVGRPARMAAIGFQGEH